MRTIGVIGVGDMGSGVAGALVRGGFRVVSDLSRRSAASRALATAAGVEDVGSLATVLAESELVLSIVPPAAAADVVGEVDAAVAGARPARAQAPFVFADCNAVAPATVLELAGALARVAPLVDVGIVGRPPARESDLGTRFYVSGPERERLLALSIPGIRLIDMGEAIGRASAIKMVYASINKGVDALLAAALLAAQRLGVRAELMTELDWSQQRLLERMRERVPFLAATAERFAPEMREIAKTYQEAGVTGDFHAGAAWIYDRLAGSSLASETRATLPATRSLDEALAAFVAALPPRATR